MVYPFLKIGCLSIDIKILYILLICPAVTPWYRSERVTRGQHSEAMDVDRGRIEFVDSEGHTRRLLVRKNCQTAITFDCFCEHVNRVFTEVHGYRIRLKYSIDGVVVVVDDELGWEETSMTLSPNEILSVVIERLTYSAGWTRISQNSLGI